MNRFIPPAWLSHRTDPGPIGLIEELVEAGAPYPVIKLVLFLARSCEKFGMPCVWFFQSSMAESAGIGESTVRTSLTWLEKRGVIGRSRELIEGRSREIIWCAWLLAPRLEGAATGAFKAPVPAPKERKWISFEDRKKTTDRVRGESRRQAAPGPEADADAAGGSLEAPPPAPTPTASAPIPIPELDQAVVAALEAEVPDEAERRELALASAGWLALHAVERVVLAIRETAARRRKGVALGSFRAYAAAILGTWAKEGHATPRLAKPSPSYSVPNVPSAAVQEADRAARAALDRLEATRERLWAALPPEEREAIRERMLAQYPENPALSRRFRAQMREQIVRCACLESMDRTVTS